MRRKLLKSCRYVIEFWEMNRTYMVLCKIIGVICFVMLWGEIFAQKRRSGSIFPSVAVKTNVLYWATASFNAGVEIGLSPKTTLDITGGYNPWTFGDNRKFKFGMVQPEFRFWPCSRLNGHFVGVHALYVKFNAGGIRFLGMKNRRYEGNFYGAGIAYGYQWLISERWNIEATIGLGYIRSDYDRYVWERCGQFLGSDKKNYFGPTKLGVSFIYIIK